MRRRIRSGLALASYFSLNCLGRVPRPSPSLPYDAATSTAEDLERHPNWIIDVRGNGGGSDSSYKPIMPWLMPDEVASASVAILATEANIEGWTRICALYAPGDAECQKSLSESIGGCAKPHRGRRGDGRRWRDVLRPRRKPGATAPLRVAILIDGGCASSCEQFALEARQSFSAKLIGQHTSGSLDYSNLRPHDLPSGARRLWYATTRSTRNPARGIYAKALNALERAVGGTLTNNNVTVEDALPRTCAVRPEESIVEITCAKLCDLD